MGQRVLEGVWVDTNVYAKQITKDRLVQLKLPQWKRQKPLQPQQDIHVLYLSVHFHKIVKVGL